MALLLWFLAEPSSGASQFFGTFWARMSTLCMGAGMHMRGVQNKAPMPLFDAYFRAEQHRR
jgi:hypothetical protein